MVDQLNIELRSGTIKAVSHRLMGWLAIFPAGKINRGPASFQRLGRRLQYANQFKTLFAIGHGGRPLIDAIQKMLAFGL